MIWASEHKFGIQTRDRLPIAQLVGRKPGSGGIGLPPEPLRAAQAAVAVARRGDQARLLGRAIDFALVCAAAAALAIAAAAIAYGTLSRPFESVSAALR